MSEVLHGYLIKPEEMEVIMKSCLDIADDLADLIVLCPSSHRHASSIEKSIRNIVMAISTSEHRGETND